MSGVVLVDGEPTVLTCGCGAVLDPATLNPFATYRFVPSTELMVDGARSELVAVPVWRWCCPSCWAALPDE